MSVYTGSTPQKELEKLNALYRKEIILTVVMVLLAGGALIAAIVKAMVPSVILLAAMLVVRLTLNRKARKDFLQGLTDSVLTCSVGAQMDQFELCSKGGIGITREDIFSAEVLPVRKEAESFISFYQGIAGTAKGMEISLNDTSIHLNKLADDKGTGVSVGIWTHFVLPKDTGRNIRILTKGMLANEIREEYYAQYPEMKLRDSEETGLGKDFYLYESCEAEDSAFKPLPASFVSGLKDLARRVPGNIALSLQGNILNIFITGRVLAPSYKINTKPSEQVLQFDPVPEYRSIVNLAKAL